MKIFHCPIYGEIEISEKALMFIDTSLFQRLRNINQTGVAKFVFPSATTSRFIHSLGVYYLTGELLTHLGLASDDPEHELIKLGGLLHDIGHGPYSHMFDNRCLGSFEGPWKHHEKRSQDMVRYLAKGKLSPAEIEFVCQIIVPETDNWKMNLVNNTLTGIDTDKLDYIVRDTRAFGLRFDVDVGRILKNCRIIDGELCFCERISDELVNLFLVRNRLYRRIYAHPVIVRYEQAFVDVLADFDFISLLAEQDVEGFGRLTDALVESTGNAEKLLAIAHRRLPKDVKPQGTRKFHSAIAFKKIKVYNRKNGAVSAFPLRLLLELSAQEAS